MKRRRKYRPPEQAFDKEEAEVLRVLIDLEKAAARFLAATREGRSISEGSLPPRPGGGLCR